MDNYLQGTITDFFNLLINNCSVKKGSNPILRNLFDKILTLQYDSTNQVVFIETKSNFYFLVELEDNMRLCEFKKDLNLSWMDVHKMTTEVTAINDNLLNNFEKDKKKAVRNLTKMGYISIDGTISQYYPSLSSFRECTANEVERDFYRVMGNSWGLISSNNLSEMLKSELPNITKSEINNFKSYEKQSRIIINEELIQDELKKALKENEDLKNPKKKKKTNRDIISQLLILRNNDIFMSKAKLYKYKDGKFLRYTSNDITGLFNSTIKDKDFKIIVQQVKNNWKVYCDSLTDITLLLKLLNEKLYKENTMKECKKDYENVLKLISKYK